MGETRVTQRQFLLLEVTASSPTQNYSSFFHLNPFTYSKSKKQIKTKLFSKTPKGAVSAKS